MFPGLVLKQLLAWQALNKAQRRYVYKNYIHRLLNSWRFKWAKMVYIFPCLWLIMMGADPLGGMLLHVFNLLVLFFVVDELVALLLISLNRKQIESYIQTHAEELAAV